MKVDSNARFTLYALSVAAFAVAATLMAIPLLFVATKGYAHFEKLGLLQPLIAATLALAIVLGTPVVRGRYVAASRKGETSPSSATIAVRLWLACFAALMLAILASSFVAKLPVDTFTRGEPRRPPAETTLEVHTNGSAPAKATVVLKAKP